MSSSSYFFTTLNALPIIMVATEKDLQALRSPPSPYCKTSVERPGGCPAARAPDPGARNESARRGRSCGPMGGEARRRVANLDAVDAHAGVGRHPVRLATSRDQRPVAASAFARPRWRWDIAGNEFSRVPPLSTASLARFSRWISFGRVG